MSQDKVGGKRPRRASSPPRTLPAAADLRLAVPAAAPKPEVIPETAGAPSATETAPAVDRGVLPVLPEGERPEAWGDAGDSNDARLLRDLPPHWSR
ncbi:MAG: hypothetical protein LBR27_01455 [Bifidobacteriaceae bacterium]|nr:hypothetical protein [Bifidobacteriaceae bacterium]